MKKILLLAVILTAFISVKAQDTIYVYQENGVIRINDLESNPLFFSPSNLSFKLNRNDFILKNGITKEEFNLGTYQEIFKLDSSGFSSQDDAIYYLTTILNRSRNDVALQDQTTQPIIINFNNIAQNTTLKASRLVGDSFITVDDTLGAYANTYVIIFNAELNRFSTFNTLSKSGDTLFLDTPLDIPYILGSFVDLTSKEMAVNGSVTPQIFGVRGVSPSPVGITVDITRIIITCITDNTVDLSKFADIAGGITNGLVLRIRNGTKFNVFNVKNNQEIAGLMYDWTVYQAINPSQGTDGFTGRLTFAGQDKIGVVLRLKPGEDLEFYVQDDLSSILSLQIVAEGHITED